VGVRGKGFLGHLIEDSTLAIVVLDFLTSAYTILYTPSMAKTVPVRELRANLSSLLDDVSDRRDHVLVTRNGAPAAALVPIDEYEALEETAEVLSDPDALTALEAGLAEIERGEVVTLSELRTELAERRPSAS
jgi:antitoxin YefM